MSAKTTETGHAVNSENFKVLISRCTGFGSRYNPVNPIITLSAINASSESCVTAMGKINVLETKHTKVIDEREKVFNPLSAYITRVNNAAEAIGLEDVHIADIKTITRKLQGKRAKPKKKVDADAAAAEPTAANETPSDMPNYVSASQMGFDNRIENFKRLFVFLSSIPEYVPNEEDLTLQSMEAILQKMIQTNADVVDVYTELNNARIDRNKILYDDKVGICDVAGIVKKYVLTVFGPTSPEYKSVKGIKFTKRKS